MGVPGIFPFFRRRYAKYVHRNKQGTNKKEYDGVYIDANALIHPAAQKVYNYGNEKFAFSAFEGYSDAELELEFLKTFFKMIMKVTDDAIPKKRLFIAIDGVAPVAKQNQQRERRMMSETPPRFNPNALSSGTELMYRVEKYLKYRIRWECTFGRWRGIEVVLSPTTSPGEGEHKLMDYIRKLKTRESVCLVGPDGDLIMLCMSLVLLPNTTFVGLQRDDQYEKGYVYLLRMTGIVKEMTQERGYKNNFLTVNNFLFTSIFLGNDFAHRIKMFLTIDDGLDMIEDVTSDLNIVKTKYIKNIPVNYIDERELKMLFSRLSDREKSSLERHSVIFSPKGEKFIDTKIIETCTHSIVDSKSDNTSTSPGTIVNGVKATIDFERYREMYYTLPGKERPMTQSEIQSMCRSYIKTLVWVWIYYTKGIPSWTWSYNHHIPPLMYDLNDYFQQGNHIDQHFIMGEPTASLVQLVTITPPRSMDLIPNKNARSVYSTFEQFYPEKFHVEYEGISQEYMAVAHIPFVDRQKIKDHIEEVAGKDAVKPPISKFFVYINDVSSKVLYSSSYGEPFETSVRVAEIVKR